MGGKQRRKRGERMVKRKRGGRKTKKEVPEGAGGDHEKEERWEQNKEEGK